MKFTSKERAIILRVLNQYVKDLKKEIRIFPKSADRYNTIIIDTETVIEKVHKTVD